jgi:glutaredoxin 3
MQAEIYSKPMCPFCDRAKVLLKQLNIPYEEFIVSTGFGERVLASNQRYVSREDLLSRYPAAKTVPQIWIDGVHVGGCTDLEAQIAQGKISAQPTL